jgi:aconitate decarboxylase
MSIAAFVIANSAIAGHRVSAVSQDSIAAFCQHAAHLPRSAMPATARSAAVRFVLDSFGVGIAGSSGPFADVLGSRTRTGPALPEARVWGTSTCLGAADAAMALAYQIHNAEFDCVHEQAVVHPMAVLLGALSAVCDREMLRGRAVSGAEIIDAVIVGVDVAAGLGVASNAPLRFFRPATAGAFGAVAAVGRVLGFDADRMRHAMGIALAQIGGTMQAHVEGSPVLAMQVGFNSRNAVVAADLAAAGVPGPADVLEGPYGYFNLFEGDFDVQPVVDSLGKVFRIEEVAHKPFPTGRATHGVVDACLQLRSENALEVADIEAVSARVPPLTHRLVGRPVNGDMAVNYARLCGSFVAAVALTRGSIGIADFTDEARKDVGIVALAHKIEMIDDGTSDPNALTPIEVEISLRDGSRLTRRLDAVYGNPANPMLPAAYLEKFRGNWQAANEPLTTGACEQALAHLNNLDSPVRWVELTRLAQSGHENS